MVFFASCLPFRRSRRRSKSDGVESPLSSAASEYGGSVLVDRRSGFSSLIVNHDSMTYPASINASDGSPESLHGSLIASENGTRQRSKNHRVSGTDTDMSPRSYADYSACDREPDRDSPWYHVARLRQALEMTTHELRVTEIELKHALIQLARERDRNDLLKTSQRENSSPTLIGHFLGTARRPAKSKRSGSCPLATYGLPTSSIDFSTINSVISDNSS